MQTDDAMHDSEESATTYNYFVNPQIKNVAIEAL